MSIYDKIKPTKEFFFGDFIELSLARHEGTVKTLIRDVKPFPLDENFTLLKLKRATIKEVKSYEKGK